jgi:hypothetical protein
MHVKETISTHSSSARIERQVIEEQKKLSAFAEFIKGL